MKLRMPFAIKVSNLGAQQPIRLLQRGGKSLLGVLALLLLTLTMTPVLGQSSTPPAHGPVIEGNRLEGQIETLNPLFCEDDICRRITSLLFPTLIAVDPATGQFTPNMANGLVASWTPSDTSAEYTFTLRDDLTWSDGEPITAYDVFFSYLTIVDDRSPSPYRPALIDTALIPVDARTVVLHFNQAPCVALSSAVFPVIPVHRYDAGFAEKAAQFFTGQIGDAVAAYAAWVETVPENARYSYVRFAPESRQPITTSGSFRYEPGRDEDAAAFRLYRAYDSVTPDAYVLVDTANRDDTVNRFINGEINFIENPPVNRRADLRAVPGVQYVQFSGSRLNYIGFNLADPARRSGEDVPLGDHPMFADEGVRRAVRLALDVPVIIDTVMQGDGQSFNGELVNVRAAESLLEAAGWKDTNGDGLRECIDCPYGEAGDTLAFTLLVDDSQPHQFENAGVISRQLEAVGFAVNTTTFRDAAELQQELSFLRFDAYLTTLERYAPYSRLPNCLLPSTDTEEPIVNGFPAVWLYVPDEVYVAGPGVQGFAPYPGAPLWNVTSWAITK